MGVNPWHACACQTTIQARHHGSVRPSLPPSSLPPFQELLEHALQEVGMCMHVLPAMWVVLVKGTMTIHRKCRGGRVLLVADGAMEFTHEA